MITLANEREVLANAAGSIPFEFRGLSTDTKPTTYVVNDRDLPNGSVFFAMDTSTVYMFNNATTSWVEL